MDDECIQRVLRILLNVISKFEMSDVGKNFMWGAK